MKSQLNKFKKVFEYEESVRLRIQSSKIV